MVDYGHEASIPDFQGGHPPPRDDKEDMERRDGGYHPSQQDEERYREILEAITSRKSLLYDTEKIASDLSRKLYLPSLAHPLDTFLRRAAAIRGLDGIVLTSFHKANVFADLSIHALVDQNQATPVRRENETSIGRIQEEFYPFQREMRTVGPYFSTGLWFKRVSDRDVWGAVTQLRERLVADHMDDPTVQMPQSLVIATVDGPERP